MQNKPFKKPLTAEEAAAKAEQEISRIMLPKGREIFGIVEQRVGGSRMIVKCFDAKTRNCRIPGSLKRRLWVREGDVVIVEPWEYGGDDKGDIVYKYTPNQVNYLKRTGKLESLNEFDEF
ncbi:MAG TPA: translation initiation factor eIF-1A [Candidatus Nanoarchaeia archaeon]|nr:translation initiation factor eIF-1A [Candidatus Nanoarchaeia archaeon]